MNPHKSTGHPARRGAGDADLSVPLLSALESRRIVGAVAQALPAWDQYTTQARLPVGPHWLDQGHRWDAFNNGHRGAQERRDPAVASAAWNALSAL